MAVNLLIVMDETGFSAWRFPTGTQFPDITLEQQAQDPKLGLQDADGSMIDLENVLTEMLQDGTGERKYCVCIRPVEEFSLE
jgi:hypothetical protein